MEQQCGFYTGLGVAESHTRQAENTRQCKSPDNRTARNFSVAEARLHIVLKPRHDIFATPDKAATLR